MLNSSLHVVTMSRNNEQLCCCSYVFLFIDHHFIKTFHFTSTGTHHIIPDPEGDLELLGKTDDEHKHPPFERLNVVVSHSDTVSPGLEPLANFPKRSSCSSGS